MKEADNSDMIQQVMEDKNVKRYAKGRLLGKGGFAQCYQFISQQTGKRYAAKIINKESLSKGKAREKLQSEISIHKSMRHQNIVKFQHFFEDHQSVYILLELCNNNTLNEILKRRRILSETEGKYYILQLIKAVHYIHSRKVIHRDLKLGNFFLSDQLEIKVGDFGLATTIAYQGDLRKTVCGTPNYIAPEILQSKKGHSYQVDIWSLGVITYALLFGKPPFETNQVNTTYQKIKKCQFTFPKNSQVSCSARNFINRMLKLNPFDRATIGQLLNDDFLNLEDIPTSMPLSSLACPPSKAFIELIKQKNMKMVGLSKEKDIESKMMKESDSQLGMNTSRTTKNIHEKAQITRQHSKMRKSQRSLGSLTRKVQIPINLIRKKITSSHHPQPSASQIKISMLYFDDQAKYGLFYKLSNNCFGMRFNDSTYLISNPAFNAFRYAVIKQSNKESDVEIFQAGHQRPQLQKKIKIINYFYKEFTKGTSGQVKQTHIKQASPSTYYVIGYFNTTSYYLFCFNTAIYQANFKDGSHLIIQHENILFVGTNKKKISCKTTNIHEHSQQIKKKYNTVINFIKIHKKTKDQPRQQTKQLHKALSKKVDKQNLVLMKNASSSKIVKQKEIIKRPFSSTTNLQILKKPFSQYQSNK